MKYENDKEGIIYLSEVYYKSRGGISSYANPTEIFRNGLLFDDPSEIRETFEMMMMAINKPIVIIKSNGDFEEERLDEMEKKT